MCDFFSPREQAHLTKSVFQASEQQQQGERDYVRCVRLVTVRPHIWVTV